MWNPNENSILTDGLTIQYSEAQIGRFASTGGWVLAKKHVTGLYTSMDLILLTAEQQSLVEEAATAVHRPCCNSYTLFPDCNHGMGMGMMNMEMPHPMHIHSVQFQVIGRKIARGYEWAYQELSAGFVNDSWKDTVLIMPGEKVQVLVRFENFAGTFLYHCHNLEHEDADMMRNYKIES